MGFSSLGFERRESWDGWVMAGGWYIMTMGQ
jgi:hypothetical protein